MGYYTPKILDKFKDALRVAYSEIESGDPHVVISNSNSKMGAVASVSLLPFLTCPDRCKDTCGEKCYAAKLANLRPAVLSSYALNTALAIRNPDVYWHDVDLACKGVRYFRFHVSGDILRYDYLLNMVRCAENNPKTEILCFTKRYELVNLFLDEGHTIPDNLHILFSGWTNLTPDNPYRLPETNVVERRAAPKSDWKICGGNCFNCACRGVGCWDARPGDTIAFHMH